MAPILKSQVDELQKKALELKATIDAGSPAPYVPGSSTYSPTGKDVFGNPVAAGTPVSRYGTTPGAPAVGTSAPGGDIVSRYYDELNKTGPTPEQEAAIRENTRKSAQTEIDAINAIYSNLLKSEQLAGEERLGEQRALASRSGIMGSDFGNAQKDKVGELNQRMIGAIEAERSMKLTEVLRGVDERATKQIEAEKLKAEGNMKDYMKHLEDTQSGAKTDIGNLAKGGVKLSDLSSDVLKRLKEQSGLDDFSFEALFNANKPKAEKTDYTYKVEGSKLFAYGVDPTTGKLVTQEKDLGITPTKDQEVKEVEGELWLVDKTKGTATKIGGPGKKDTDNIDPAVLKDLQDAQAAKDAGADADLVRRRFLETHPKQANFYDQYFKIGTAF